MSNASRPDKRPAVTMEMISRDDLRLLAGSISDCPYCGVNVWRHRGRIISSNTPVTACEACKGVFGPHGQPFDYVPSVPLLSVVGSQGGGHPRKAVAR